MFKDLEEQFENATTAKSEALFKIIIERANTDKVAFQQYLNGLEYGFSSNRCLIYEAISDYPQGFDDLILYEIKTIIELVESGDKDAEEELISVFWLSSVENMPIEFYQKMIDLFIQKLNSPNDKVKIEIIDSLFLVLDESDLDLDTIQLRTFQALLKDKNLEIRLKTYSTLEDSDLLPKGFQLSIMDKLKKKFFRHY
jgi:hypothetical protein